MFRFTTAIILILTTSLIILKFLTWHYNCKYLLVERFRFAGSRWEVANGVQQVIVVPAIAQRKGCLLKRPFLYC